MEGLIYDIKRFALHDGPGIRTTVFFKGCPLNCWWCHNPESIKACVETSSKATWLDGKKFVTEENTGIRIDTSALMTEILKDKAFMDESGGGVTFSGGEPLLQHEFLIGVLSACREENIHTAIDTSGYTQEIIFHEIAGLTDLFLFDVKLIEEEKHILYTGVSNKWIFKNLKYLHQQNFPVILRIPVIPGINDGDQTDLMIHFLMENFPIYREVHLLPYHSIAAHKYERFGIENRLSHLPGLSDEDVMPLMEKFNRYGYEVKIGG